MNSASNINLDNYRLVLSASFLSAGYADRMVFDALSFNITEGEFTAIIGPNGSGKSTLLKCLAGLKEPFAGQVSLEAFANDPMNDVLLQTLSVKSGPDLARILAFLPQTTHWEFSLTVRELVSLGRYPYSSSLGYLSGEDKMFVQCILEQTDLSRLSDRPIECLSGGELQRAQLAACFAQNPRFLLLDEPTSHLDWGQTRRLMQLLKDFCFGTKKRRTVLGIFHDLDAVREFCTRVICLKSGRIVAQGVPEQILTSKFIQNLYLE